MDIEKLITPVFLNQDTPSNKPNAVLVLECEFSNISETSQQSSPKIWCFLWLTK